MVNRPSSPTARWADVKHRYRFWGPIVAIAVAVAAIVAYSSARRSATVPPIDSTAVYEIQSASEWTQYRDPIYQYQIQVPPGWYVRETPSANPGSSAVFFSSLDDPADGEVLSLEIIRLGQSFSPDSSLRSYVQHRLNEMTEELPTAKWSTQATSTAGPNEAIRAVVTIGESLQVMVFTASEANVFLLSYEKPDSPESVKVLERMTSSFSTK